MAIYIYLFILSLGVIALATLVEAEKAYAKICILGFGGVNGAVADLDIAANLAGMPREHVQAEAASLLERLETALYRHEEAENLEALRLEVLEAETLPAPHSGRKNKIASKAERRRARQARKLWNNRQAWLFQADIAWRGTKVWCLAVDEIGEVIAGLRADNDDAPGSSRREARARSGGRKLAPRRISRQYREAQRLALLD